MEAVVWTDAIQTIVLMTGLLGRAGGNCRANVDGGVSTVFSTALADGKMHLANLDFGPRSRDHQCSVGNPGWHVLSIALFLHL